MHLYSGTDFLRANFFRGIQLEISCFWSKFRYKYTPIHSECRFSGAGFQVFPQPKPC